MGVLCSKNCRQWLSLFFAPATDRKQKKGKEYIQSCCAHFQKKGGMSYSRQSAPEMRWCDRFAIASFISHVDKRTANNNSFSICKDGNQLLGVELLNACSTLTYSVLDNTDHPLTDTPIHRAYNVEEDGLLGMYWSSKHCYQA